MKPTVQNRIDTHPVLAIPEKEFLSFFWNGRKLSAKKGEVISSALFANGIRIFGHSHKDGSARGIFCANGQCAQCTVIADGIPVKSCMTQIRENMQIRSLEGLPILPDVSRKLRTGRIEQVETDVLIIGGGPAGLSAAIELEKYDIPVIVVDDKDEPGGKLVLQTHKFFGSQEDSHAGTRGMDIGRLLAGQLEKAANVQIWTNSTALYVFSDRKVGVLKKDVYKLISPKIILNAAGAREKFLRFKGNTLAGIYGAGAFQTLVNRDLVKPAEKLFIIGGGNVGLIAGYHALQAGIDVAGVAEALPECGGYKVHEDKLRRLGVPIYTSHSIVEASGKESVASVTIAEIDKNFNPVDGTYKTFECDTVLIAVGLEPVAEFTREAETAGIKVFSAGDADQIAEASSAMFNGRIKGLEIARYFKPEIGEIPAAWHEKADILKSHPGKVLTPQDTERNEGIFPVFHCRQEIPCNPCSTVCPENAIRMKGDPITGMPQFSGSCKGCMKCLAICPGLAVTIVDCRKDTAHPTVFIPYEMSNHVVKKGDLIQVNDVDAGLLGVFPVLNAKPAKKSSRTWIIRVKLPADIARKAVAFTIRKEPGLNSGSGRNKTRTNQEEIVCLCERVSADRIRALIDQGMTDLNQIKAVTRAGMGACGYKTCDHLIKQLFREKKIDLKNVVNQVRRPLYVEVPLGKFAGGGKK